MNNDNLLRSCCLHVLWLWTTCSRKHGTLHTEASENVVESISTHKHKQTIWPSLHGIQQHKQAAAWSKPALSNTGGEADATDGIQNLKKHLFFYHANPLRQVHMKSSGSLVTHCTHTQALTYTQPCWSKNRLCFTCFFKTHRWRFRMEPIRKHRPQKERERNTNQLRKHNTWS